MSTLHTNIIDRISKQEAFFAQQASKLLTSHTHETTPPKVQLALKGVKKKVTLPLAALELLLEILQQVAEGNAVSLIPIHAELSTQEAADLLNVSRPYLVSLLEKGEIPHRKVGTKRRVLAKDVLAYNANLKKARLKTLAKLSKQAQDLDMGY